MSSSNNHIMDLCSDDDSSSGRKNPSFAWDESAQRSEKFKTAATLFSGRKYGSPTVAEQQAWLRSLMSHSGDDHFTGMRVQWYKELKKGVSASYSTSKSTLAKNWNGHYCSDRLALLIYIEEEEKKDRKKKAPKQSAPTRSTKKKGGRSKSTDLDKLIAKILKVYHNMVTKHDQEKKKDENKKSRTPSLDYHKSGKRPQDDHMYDPKKASKSACPACGHFSTMAISSHEEVNAENEKRRKAAAKGEAFKADSATVGCFCHANNDCTGDDCEICAAMIEANPDTDISKSAHKCTCQVTFKEHHRHSIAIAVKKNTVNEEKMKKRAGAAQSQRPEGTVTSAYTKFILDTIHSRAVRESQHSDDRSVEEIIQDVGTSTGHQIIGDISVTSNQELRRGLQTILPRSTTVQFREGGTTKSMTLEKARKAAKKQGGGDQQPMFNGSTHACPTQDRFWRNKSAHTPSAAAVNIRTEPIPDANRARRNKLSHYPLVIEPEQQHHQQPAGITPGSSVMSIERVRRCAKRITTDSLTTPQSRKKSRKIYQALAKGDPAITTAVHDCYDAPNSEAAVKSIGMLCFDDDEEKDD
ncbi:hypothetical protein ACHAWT_010817 [Skeletonema menzelii]